MKEVIDHLNRTVQFHFPPKKIISLCPGITETLYALNLEKQIVGRTKYCIYPKSKVDDAVIVGGTKNIDLPIIQSLQPDLIIAEKEENTKEIVETLEKQFRVYVAEVQSVDGAYEMIKSIAEITDRDVEAEQLIRLIQTNFDTLPHARGKKAAYVIWRKPYMVVGNDTYINSLLTILGFVNPFAALEGRYPVVTEQQFQEANLDYVFLATEPFPFNQTHKQQFATLLPDVKPIIIDGEMFWYGAKMIEAATYFRTFFHEYTSSY